MHCANCGKAVTDEDSIVFEGARICATCKSEYFQKIREGTIRQEIIRTPFFRPFWSRFLVVITTAVIFGYLSEAGSGMLSRRLRTHGDSVMGYSLSFGAMFLSALLLPFLFSYIFRIRKRDVFLVLFFPTIIALVIYLVSGSFLMDAIQVDHSSALPANSAEIILNSRLRYLAYCLFKASIILIFTITLTLLIFAVGLIRKK